MAKAKFESKQYWQERVGFDADLSVVGHRSLGGGYNQYVYQRRVEVLTEFIRLLNLDPKNLRILDIGCGSGFYTNLWKSQGVKDYVGLDISQGSIQALSERYKEYRFFRADISRLGAIDKFLGTFDLITVFDVLYHITDDREFANSLENISKSFRDNGYAIIFDQLADKDYSLISHVKFRGRETYRQRLRTAGLSILHTSKLFLVLVPPVFGNKLFDTFIAGAYKLIGYIMKQSDSLGRFMGKAAYKMDNFLLKSGVDLPNHEAFVVKKMNVGRNCVTVPRLKTREIGTKDVDVPKGIPTKGKYNELISMAFFKTMEEYSDAFLERYIFLRKQNRWVRDPFHQWSRQWEYPFVYSSIRSYLNGRGLLCPKILDAGSGITFFPYFLLEKLRGSELACYDYDEKLEQLFRNVNDSRKGGCGVQFDAGDLGSLPYVSSSFDVVYCISVLEHTENYSEIINELARVLKPGGALILTFDIALDGVSDISCEKAESLLMLVKKKFSGSGDAKVCNLLPFNDILTSLYIKSIDKELLPWRFPLLSLLKIAIAKGKFPTGITKNLTVYCDTFFKMDKDESPKSLNI